MRCVVTLLRTWCSFNGPSNIGQSDAWKVVHGKTQISTELLSSNCYIPRAHSLSNIYDMVGANRTPKTHVLKRDWTMCSKIVHHSKRNSQYDRGHMYDHLVTKRNFTLTTSIIFEFNFLIISHYLRTSFPSRSGRKEKIVS